MGLPVPPSAPSVNASVASAPVASAPTTSSDAKAIKQFGRATTEEGIHIPAPKPCGVDLVELNKRVFALMNEFVGSNGVKIEDLEAGCRLDKPSVPGHKEGRIAYSTANMVIQVCKANSLLNKVRTAGGGFVKIKQELAKKDDLLAKLRAKLIALGQDEESINAMLSA